MQAFGWAIISGMDETREFNNNPAQFFLPLKYVFPNVIKSSYLHFITESFTRFLKNFSSSTMWT